MQEAKGLPTLADIQGLTESKTWFNAASERWHALTAQQAGSDFSFVL